MASGDITDEYDGRLSKIEAMPICGLTLEIVVADGTSEKEQELDETDHSCMNCLLMDLYLQAPQLATAAKEVKLELLAEAEDLIYSTGDLDASSAIKVPAHSLQRGLRGKTTFKITCDENVSGAKTFKITTEGL